MIMLCLGASSLRWTSFELSQNFRPSKHGSAVWVGSFAWLAKISILSLFLCFISFCWSDCDDNALRWVLRLFGGRASNYLKTFVLQNMGRQFGSAVSLGWQKLVLVCECFNLHWFSEFFAFVPCLSFAKAYLLICSRVSSF